VRETHNIEQLRHPDHTYDGWAEGPGYSGSSSLEGPTLAAKLQELLDRIRGLDKSMDTALLEKIAKIKKAIADGTYHVSAAEVARKIIDQTREP
jgi:hypothetical protein